jgi:hypothetical protein
MAFEPLQTDEKLTAKTKPAKDMDDAMLAGCTGFVVTSLLSYALVVWPFFVFTESERGQVLALCAALGMIPSVILGIVAARKFGLAGGFGYLGGAMAVAVFLYLRIQQSFLAAMAKQAPAPDYPDVLNLLVPTGWIIQALIVLVVFVPKGEYESEKLTSQP